MQGPGFMAFRVAALLGSAALGSLAVTSSVRAQTVEDRTGADTGAVEEVIVTARKRSEANIAVPVAITAVTKTELERYGARELSQIAAQVPGLIIQPIPGGGGGSVALRGVSSTPANPSGDQAVSFNVDGVQLGSANIIRLGQIDMQQLEVYKGPQALFFGKNSPGGIISIRTADPTTSFEMSGVADHEFEAKETTGQLVASGPLTDDLSARLVFYAARADGDRDNLAPVDPSRNAFEPVYRHAAHRKEVFSRLTLLYRPDDNLDIRFKYNYGRLTGSSPFTTAERIACPYDAPQAMAVGGQPAVDDCKADGKYYQGGINPAVLQRLGAFVKFDGVRTEQHLGSTEVNYEAPSGLKFTSVTGYYDVRDRFHGNTVYQPATVLIGGSIVHRRDLSQEVRIYTDRPDAKLNVMVGAYYQNTRLYNAFTVVFDNPGVLPTLIVPSAFTEYYTDASASSAFGQVIWNITPQLELAGGARYSHESRSLDFLVTQGVPGAFAKTYVPTARPDISFNDLSPEVTLSYRPNSRLTVFAAYRNGFKSGGFNTGSGSNPGANQDLTYRPEEVSGGEVGLKAVVGDLRVAATAYTYNYKDLQVSTYDPQRLRSTVVNAADAKIQGLEAEATWRPARAAGLELRLAGNYNHARYEDFLVGCYTGQLIADGCNLLPNAAGNFQLQDLAGEPLNLSPDFTGSVGANYAGQLSERFDYGLSIDANYSSAFFAQLEESPFSRQSAYWMLNASARVATADGRWEVALIGRNLTNVYRSRFVSQVPLSGIAARTGTNTPGGLTDYTGQVNRGREIRLQVRATFN